MTMTDRRLNDTKNSSHGRRPARLLMPTLVAMLFAAAPLLLLVLVLYPGFLFDADGELASKHQRSNGADHAGPGAGRSLQDFFRETAEDRGLRFQHERGARGGFLFPEIMSGGVCLLDFDRDGWLDVYFVQGGTMQPESEPTSHNQLFRNRGDGTFVDVTVATGTGDSGYGMGCTVGDYDADGDDDLYITNVGPNVLLQNNGDGTFRDVTKAAGVGDSGWSCSTAFLDIDQDADLDLFVTNYLVWDVASERSCFSGTGKQDYCKPNNYKSPAKDTLYRNEGNGTFVDVSEASGIQQAYGNGLGVALGDFDADGRTDIYVANDGMPNLLWMNQGDGRFKNDAVLAGCAVNVHGAAEAGMGVAALDLNNDRLIDLFMTHLREETNTLYINRGGWFDDVTSEMGLSQSSLPYTGFGMGFADFDHDGLQDVFITNGRVGLWEPSTNPDDPYGEPDILFVGEGEGRFTMIKPNTPSIPTFGTGRGAAFGDVDNDGDIDVVVVNNGGRAQLWDNRTNADGKRNGHSIMFLLEREDGCVEQTTVSLRAGDRQLTRVATRAYSYCSGNDHRVHFGLGTAEMAEDIHIRWPDGSTQEIPSLESGFIYTVSHVMPEAPKKHPFTVVNR